MLINLILFFVASLNIFADEVVQLENIYVADIKTERVNWFEANKFCDELNISQERLINNAKEDYNYKLISNWRLPNRYELRLIYDNLSLFKNLNNGDWLWTCKQVENYKDFIWLLGFFNGYDLFTNKKDLGSFVCVQDKK